jgi:hypothetical protein
VLKPRGIARAKKQFSRTLLGDLIFKKEDDDQGEKT